MRRSLNISISKWLSTRSNGSNNRGYLSFAHVLCVYRKKALMDLLCMSLVTVHDCCAAIAMPYNSRSFKSTADSKYVTKLIAVRLAGFPQCNGAMASSTSGRISALPSGSGTTHARPSSNGNFKKNCVQNSCFK